MIDYARPYDQNMCDLYLPPTTPAPARLDDFQVFKKGTAFIYGNYYSESYEGYSETGGLETVYHNLVNPRDYRREDWRRRFVQDWNEDDTVSWLIETAQNYGFSEYDVPCYNFRLIGSDLKMLKREEVFQRMIVPNVELITSRRLADVIFDRLQVLISQGMHENLEPTIFRYGETDPYQNPDPAQTVLDLDSLDYKNKGYAPDYRPGACNSSLLVGCDSSDDAEDVFRASETPSPVCYGSDGSKSGDEDDKRKSFKRPPGRPKGSGRKISKRPRSVSVPEFLRNLLLDARYCPSIIKWEDRALKKFRFVKPDEVAKLWGKMKQNDNMTFEKFSRAMRYHYRQLVLLSVPTARLVYQFGPKGPDVTKASSLVVKVKSEADVNDIVYS